MIDKTNMFSDPPEELWRNSLPATIPPAPRQTFLSYSERGPKNSLQGLTNARGISIGIESAVLEFAAILETAKELNTDAFGATTFVKRANSKHLSFPLLLDNSSLAYYYKLLSDLESARRRRAASRS